MGGGRGDENMNGGRGEKGKTKEKLVEGDGRREMKYSKNIADHHN